MITNEDIFKNKSICDICKYSIDSIRQIRALDCRFDEKAENIDYVFGRVYFKRKNCDVVNKEGNCTNFKQNEIKNIIVLPEKDSSINLSRSNFIDVDE